MAHNEEGLLRKYDLHTTDRSPDGENKGNA